MQKQSTPLGEPEQSSVVLLSNLYEFLVDLCDFLGDLCGVKLSHST